VLQAKEQALHIDIEDRVELGFGIIDELRIDIDPRAFGGEIDFAGARLGIFDCPSHVRLACKISRNEEAIATSFSQEFQRFLTVRRAPANGPDRGTSTSERNSRRAADARSPACHESNSLLEGVHEVFPLHRRNCRMSVLLPAPIAALLFKISQLNFRRHKEQ
jgi:hypothetical protein